VSFVPIVVQNLPCDCPNNETIEQLIIFAIHSKKYLKMTSEQFKNLQTRLDVLGRYL
jgi:hypothetical protein